MARESAYRRRINKTSPTIGVADIGLMILVVFMCMTEWETERYGINMKLAPWANISLPVNIDELPSTIMIDINSRNQLMIDGERIHVHELRFTCKMILLNALNDIQDDDTYKYVVARMRINRASTYNVYIAVLNEIVAAKNEILDEATLKGYGLQYKKLDMGQRKHIHEQNPIVIDDLDYKAPWSSW